MRASIPKFLRRRLPGRVLLLIVVAWLCRLFVAPALAAAQPSAPAAQPSTPAVHPFATVRVRVQGEDDKPAPGALVRSERGQTALTDASGIASLRLPLGPRTLIVSKLGFAPDTLRVDVPEAGVEISAVLREAPVQIAEIVVSSTRTERRVADEPTRVEVTSREDVEEQIAASPGNVAELLTEAGGVRVQRTSAGLGSASVRVRGLSGRYTKFLSDGLPLFGLSAEGLAPLQIPPIDLERVEVIKGVASALYGPTALGGVVNLVSQRAGAQRQALLNRTSRGGTDAVLWDARPLGSHWGATLLAGGNFQSKKDIDGDGWADLPGYRRAVARPRLFWADSTGDSWFFTGGATLEAREGGTVDGGRVPSGQPFQEKLDTGRGDVGTVGRFILGAHSIFSARGSVTEEWRTHHFGAVRERDRRNTAFAEATLAWTRGPQMLVAGAALERDAYHALDVPRMDYGFRTPGFFAEHLWSPASWLGLSSSARADFHNVYGSYVSPRISALIRPSRRWNARLSAGSGVFAPTPFTDETEAIGLSRLRPLADLGVERAQGLSADLDGKIGPVELDGSAFATAIDRPVALRAVAGADSELELVNAAQPTRTGGVEFYARYEVEPVSIIASYAFLHATELDVERGVRRGVPLDPRHAGGVTVVYEEEGNTRIGLEAYYTGRQPLADDPYRTESRPYVFVDALIQQRFGRLLVFLHGEDLNDVRQTKWDPLLRPTPGMGGAWTTEVWAPLEGRVINLGLRWSY